MLKTLVCYSIKKIASAKLARNIISNLSNLFSKKHYVSKLPAHRTVHDAINNRIYPRRESRDLHKNPLSSRWNSNPKTKNQEEKKG